MKGARFINKKAKTFNEKNAIEQERNVHWSSLVHSVGSIAESTQEVNVIHLPRIFIDEKWSSHWSAPTYSRGSVAHTVHDASEFQQQRNDRFAS